MTALKVISQLHKYVPYYMNITFSAVLTLYNGLGLG